MSYKHEIIKPMGISFSERNIRYWRVEKCYINDIFIVKPRTRDMLLVFKKCNSDDYKAYGELNNGTLSFSSFEEAERFVEERMLYEL